ncbi:hypothetical protein BU23DRAFT_460615 [Bimuria novae-zelandiae CBS 107.79]|uniref:Capsule polysaccharide biosynthesis protein n=1 Tax=Bimuria novae-zelandiae CBS 107.79 TaxID=1447943 RepID=A0A6A5VDJ5_9PLEO|nr:hypothetical protein BU23DRAFT_460615 [Bimuria novae-zelandiae CBS 107.79]
MESPAYPLPPSVHALPPSSLDLRPDAQIDHAILHPGPITSEKNIWFFWHTGFTHMHPYTRRNIRAWHRRFSRSGWTIRVLDRQPSSPLNIENFLDVNDEATFPRAFTEGVIGGEYAAQHTSDLVRWPLLLKYGGVYADVGLMQIGDLDGLWNATIGDPASPWEVVSYNAGGPSSRSLTNYFLCAGKDNALFARCHKLLLLLWAADGGKSSTDGMCDSPLLKGVPNMGGTFSVPGIVQEDGTRIEAADVGRLLTDYIIQGQAMTMVMSCVDEDDGWDGPKYCAEHVYAVEYMQGSQLINEFTAWDGEKAFRLMSLPLPKEEEEESEEQREARLIVEGCLSRSFGFKLAHGLIIKVLGQTLGSLWRANEGADDVPGTYAHWLRHGTMYWCPDELPERQEWQVEEPIKRGPLLREN